MKAIGSIPPIEARHRMTVLSFYIYVVELVQECIAYLQEMQHLENTIS